MDRLGPLLCVGRAPLIESWKAGGRDEPTCPSQYIIQKFLIMLHAFSLFPSPSTATNDNLNSWACRGNLATKAYQSSP